MRLIDAELNDVNASLKVENVNLAGAQFHNVNLRASPSARRTFRASHQHANLDGMTINGVEVTRMLELWQRTNGQPHGKAKRINLALQGGGAHGAFTWGVLDRLLEATRSRSRASPAPPPGALNGAALKAGLARGSREAARENLAWLWEQVGAITDPRITPWLEAVAPAAVSSAIEASLPFAFGDSVARMVSPYAAGPFYSNPLRRIVERFHYDAVCGDPGPPSTSAPPMCAPARSASSPATRSGPRRSWPRPVCRRCSRRWRSPTPQTGRMEAYWDGGYTGNPALFPLFEPGLPGDIVVVNINPLTATRCR
jgi:NTE family protein